MTPQTIPDTNAHPFRTPDAFEAQEAVRLRIIRRAIEQSAASRWTTAQQGHSLTVHPSTKGHALQVTVYWNGKPISDSQHDSTESAARRIAEHSRLTITETA